MLKSTYLGGAMVGLVLMLVACGGAGVDLPQAEMPPTAELSQPEAEQVATDVAEVMVDELDEPAMTEEDVMVEEVVTEESGDVVESMSVGEEPVPEEEMAGTEQDSMVEEVAAMDEDVTEAEMAETEPETPLEEGVAAQEETMSEEASTSPQGPTEEQRQLLERLAVLGTPSELGNEVWLNSEPLKLADLRGQVTIVEFWTYG